MSLDALKSPVVAVIAGTLGMAYVICMVIAGLIWVNHPGAALPDQLATIISGGYSLLLIAVSAIFGIHIGSNTNGNGDSKTT